MTPKLINDPHFKASIAPQPQRQLPPVRDIIEYIHQAIDLIGLPDDPMIRSL